MSDELEDKKKAREYFAITIRLGLVLALFVGACYGVSFTV